MADISIKIKNMAQIRAAFLASPVLMTRELNKAIAKTVFTVEGRSKKNTPVDTGRLRASTYSRLGNLKGEVGTDTNYDIFVHDGTRFMKARPYLLNAVQDSEHDYGVFFKQAVDNVLKEIVRKI